MKLSIVIITAALVSSSAFAQDRKKRRKSKSYSKTRSVKRLKRTKTVPKAKDKNIEISVGYNDTSLEDDSGDKVSGEGLQARVAKVFTLSNAFTTATSLTGNIVVLDEDQLFGSSPSIPVDAYAYDVGLAQRLSYNIVMDGFLLKPFIEAGASVGTLALRSEGTINSVSYDNKLDVNYFQYGGSLGVQFVLASGVVPFIKYTRSQMVFSDRLESEETANGQTTSQTTISNSSSDERTLDRNEFLLGIGILF